MTKATNPKLPDKLSALMRIAVADLKKVERSKKYLVEMGTWHLPITDEVIASGGWAYDDNVIGKCAVCLAGAVMARTLRSRPSAQCTPDCFDADTNIKLSALDYIRCGYLGCALETLGRSSEVADEVEDDADVDGVLGGLEEFAYREDPVRFKNALTKLADWLEARGE